MCVHVYMRIVCTCMCTNNVQCMCVCVHTCTAVCAYVCTFLWALVHLHPPNHSLLWCSCSSAEIICGCKPVGFFKDAPVVTMCPSHTSASMFHRGPEAGLGAHEETGGKGLRLGLVTKSGDKGA